MGCYLYIYATIYTTMLLVDAIGYLFAGFPDFMFFQDFVLKFQGLISSSDSCSNSSSLDIKQVCLSTLQVTLSSLFCHYDVNESPINPIFFR